MEESWPMFRPNRWVVERFCSAGKMVQREISRALVLNLSGKAVLGTAQDIFVLDSAFALIEAHPAKLVRGIPNDSIGVWLRSGEVPYKR